MKNSTYPLFVAEAGSSIERAAVVACDRVRESGEKIALEFNGLFIEVSPGMTPDEICDEWFRLNGDRERMQRIPAEGIKVEEVPLGTLNQVLIGKTGFVRIKGVWWLLVRWDKKSVVCRRPDGPDPRRTEPFSWDKVEKMLALDLSEYRFESDQPGTGGGVR